MQISKRAAILHTALMIIVILFQIALALGAPWGQYAMGGSFPGVYPVAMRVAAAGQALFLIFWAAIILARAGLAFARLQKMARHLIWLFVILSSLATLLNAITPSGPERAIWLPVSVGLLLCNLAVAKLAQ